MKTIKIHIPTKQLGYLKDGLIEIEFDDYEDYTKNYAKVYVEARTLHKEALTNLKLQKGLKNNG